MDIIETVLYSKEVSQKGLQLIDCDWSDHYGLLVILKKSKTYIMQINDSEISFKNIICTFPLIRWIDHTHFLIADARNRNNRENLYILNTEGKVINSFNCGDAIEDIVTSKEGLWISYFDEGVFGRGISTEGLVLFAYDGTPLFRYHSDLLDRPSISDCYAICKGKSNSLWLFSYTNFPLLCINPIIKKLDYYAVPDVLSGSSALCIRGKFAYFFSPYNFRNELYCWEISKNNVQKIGKINGMIRGLSSRESNHFLSLEGNNIKAYKIINAKEYEYFNNIED